MGVNKKYLRDNAPKQKQYFYNKYYRSYLN